MDTCEAWEEPVEIEVIDTRRLLCRLLAQT